MNAPQHLDGEALLNAIAVQQGILVERAEGIYSFSHLTLQEYLTAQYIADNNRVSELVEKHLFDPRWKEVFLLVAGLMREGANQLLRLMEAKIRTFLKTPLGSQRLVPLLNWGERVTAGSDGDFSPVAKRAIALAYAFSNVYVLANANAFVNANFYMLANTYTFAKVYVLANANAFANIYAFAFVFALRRFVNVARELDLEDIFSIIDFTTLLARLETLKVRIPDKKQPKDVHCAFAKKIIAIWLNAFHLTPKLTNLSKQEIKRIDQKYFYGNWLMVECKKAAVMVSPVTWEKIEERMLRAKV